MTESPWLSGVQAEAASLLGLPAPLVFPAALVEVFAAGTDVLLLKEADLPDAPGGPHSTPRPEFGVLGPDMPAYFHDYELAEYLPGAWPLALDGGGGIYCLDLRSVIADRSDQESVSPLVWSHAGNLGWRPDEHVVIATDPDTFLRTVAVRASLRGPDHDPTV